MDSSQLRHELSATIPYFTRSSLFPLNLPASAPCSSSEIARPDFEMFARALVRSFVAEAAGERLHTRPRNLHGGSECTKSEGLCVAWMEGPGPEPWVDDWKLSEDSGSTAEWCDACPASCNSSVLERPGKLIIATHRNTSRTFPVQVCLMKLEGNTSHCIHNQYVGLILQCADHCNGPICVCIMSSFQASGDKSCHHIPSQRV